MQNIRILTTRAQSNSYPKHLVPTTLKPMTTRAQNISYPGHWENRQLRLVLGTILLCTSRTQDNSYLRHFEPGATHNQHNSYPGHLLPRKTLTQDNSYPRQLEPRTNQSVNDHTYYTIHSSGPHFSLVARVISFGTWAMFQGKGHVSPVTIITIIKMTW